MAIKITYFVHGTTTDNENNLATGWLPGKLSKLGVKQAKGLRKQIKKRFDAIFCSDLKRAADSAKLCFGESYKIIKDKRLRECDYGAFTGKSDEFKYKLADYVKKPFPGGESYKDAEKRMKSFLDFLKQKYNGKHIAIVAHQAPQLALEVLLKQKTWRQAIKEDWRRKKAWQPGWKYVLRQRRDKRKIIKL